MAMPRKGRRTIQIAEDTFYWRAGLPDYQVGGFPAVHIEHSVNPAAKIDVWFDGTGLRLNSVTPDMVRQVIEMVMRTGWNPWTARETVFIKNAADHVVLPEASHHA